MNNPNPRDVPKAQKLIMQAEMILVLNTLDLDLGQILGHNSNRLQSNRVGTNHAQSAGDFI